MKFDIIGKNGYVPTKQVEDYLRKRLDKPIELLNPDWVLGVNVVLKEYKDRSQVEVTIPCKGMTLRSETSDPDILRAIDRSRDRLIAQIRKHKNKLKDHMSKKGIVDMYATDDLHEDDLAFEDEAKIVRNKRFVLTPMTVEEAVMKMEMLGHSFFVFLNMKTDQVNVVYLRHDGNYGLIETDR